MAVPVAVSLALTNGGFAAVNPALVAAVVPGEYGCIVILAGGASLDVSEPQDIVVRKLFPPPAPRAPRPDVPMPGWKSRRGGFGPGQ